MKIFALDLFGTIFNMSNVDKNELRNYGQHLRNFYETGIWEPLELPAHWEYSIPPFPDSKEALNKLRNYGLVTTCSNAPLGLTAKMLKRHNLRFDAILPLEMTKAYKTDPRTYDSIRHVFQADAPNIYMITANKNFGDIEAAQSLGMNGILIRDPSARYESLLEFANVCQ